MILEYVDETGVSPEIASEMETGNNVVMGTAKTLLLAYANDNAISPETDTAIAMTTAELYLQAKGIGTCWAGYLKRMANNIPGIREMLLRYLQAAVFTEHSCWDIRRTRSIYISLSGSRELI